MNEVLLLGRLGKDPELKAVKSTHVCKFSLATSKKVGNDGDVKEYTQWHNITVWGKVGENCAKYLTKGSRALIKGEIEYREYEKDGVKRYATDIIAHKVEFIDPSKNTEGRQGDLPKPEAKASYTTDQFDEIPF